MTKIQPVSVAVNRVFNNPCTNKPVEMLTVPLKTGADELARELVMATGKNNAGIDTLYVAVKSGDTFTPIMNETRPLSNKKEKETLFALIKNKIFG